MRPRIEKLGTVDCDIVEANPVVFAGAPVAKGAKVGTIPNASPPKDRITVV